MRIVIIFALLIIPALSLPVSTPTQAQARNSSRRRARKPHVSTPPCPKMSAAITTPSGLTYMITHHGDGQPVKPGESVSVHYTGMLTNGIKFDSSRDHDQPFEFKLGAGNVIKGWDEGVGYLRVGDHAILVIPPQLAYGSKGVGNGLIPPDSTLIFIIEAVRSKAP